MDSVHFSVVIPSYNNASYLDHAITSVVGQTYPHWEMLLVDDGSRDGSIEICRAWTERDTRIRFLFHPGHANKGVSATRNLGISNAKYPFICLLDSDDVWFPDKLGKQCDAIVKNPGVDLLYTMAEVIDESGAPVQSQPEKVAMLNRRPVFGSGPAQLTRDFNTFIKSPPRIPASSVVFRKNGWKFNEGLANQVEDSLLFLEIIEKGNVLFIPEVLVKYRVHGGQWNQKLNPIRKLNARFELYFELLKRVERRNRASVCRRLLFESLSKAPAFLSSNKHAEEGGILRGNVRRFLLSGYVGVIYKLKFLYYVMKFAVGRGGRS